MLNFLRGFLRGRGGSLSWQFNSYVLNAVHWKYSTDKAPKMSSRNLSLAGEKNIHYLFALVKWNVVTDTCLHSGFPETGRVVVETSQIFMPLARSRVSLFWDWQWERLAYFFSVGEALWSVQSVNSSCSHWISFSFSSSCLAQGPGVQQIRWMEKMCHLAARLVL